MKTKVLTALIACMLACVCLFVFAACGYSQEDFDYADGSVPGFGFGLEFKLNSKGSEYSVVKYMGTDTEIIIPETYMGLPVTGIDEAAF